MFARNYHPAKGGATADDPHDLTVLYRYHSDNFCVSDCDSGPIRSPGEPICSVSGPLVRPPIRIGPSRARVVAHRNIERFQVQVVHHSCAEGPEDAHMGVQTLCPMHRKRRTTPLVHP